MFKKREILIALSVLALVGCGGKEAATNSGKSDTAGSVSATAGSTGQQASSGNTSTTGSEAPAGASASVGAQMPAYKAQWLDGKPFDLAAEKGNVVFLNVWATWCNPCRAEIPELQKMHDQYASQGFKVIGVSLDDEGTAETVRQFVKENKMGYPVALDPEGKLANTLQTTVVPTSVLIDRTGKVVWKEAGALGPDESELKAALTAALAQTRG